MKFAGWLAVLVAVAGLGCQSSTMTAAKLYIKQEEPQKAREQLALVLQSEPDNAEAHFLMGQLLGDEGRYGEMVAHFNSSAAIGPKFEAEIEQTRRLYWVREYNAGVGHAQGEAPNYVLARHSFHNATLIDEGALDAWRNLAFVYYQTDSTDAAIATYQRIASAAPEDARAFFNLGSLYLREGRLNEAIRALSQGVKIDPENLNGLTNLAQAQAQAEDYENAEANYRKIIEQTPDDFRPYFNLGNLYWQQEKYAAAKRAYEEVLALEPDDGGTGDDGDGRDTGDTGAAHDDGEGTARDTGAADTGDTGAAHDDGEGTAHDTGAADTRDTHDTGVVRYVDARYNLAMVYLATGDRDGALPFLEQLAEQMPNNALVWMHLGTVYAHKDLVEKSEAAFARAAELERE